MRLLKAILILPLSVLLFAFIGCGGGGGGVSLNSNTGRLSLSLTDATTNEYKAVYVTIKEVKVNVVGGEGEGTEQWQVVASPNKIYNLLDLVNGVMQNLGVSELSAGHYTQMRLIIGEDIDVVSNNGDLNLNGTSHVDTTFANYIIKQDDSVSELKIPSGYQTGIKLVYGFDIVAGSTVDLILDFDAAKSVVKRGNSGAYNLKPTIKVIGTQNNATLTGMVTDSGTSNPVGGALVTAQIYNFEAMDEKDKVTVFASTLTDDSGNYKMYLAPGDYFMVVTAAGYSSKNVPYTAVLNSVDERDFSLDPAENTGTVSGKIVLDTGETGAVTISFRQSVVTPAADIEVAFLSIDIESYAIPVSFSQELPYGTYKIVASMPDHATKVIDNLVVDATSEDMGTLDWSTFLVP